MKPTTLLLPLIALALGACGTTPQPTAACPAAGIYVGKCKMYLDGIREVVAPVKVTFMPDGKTAIFTVQGPNGSGALPIRGEFVSQNRFHAFVPKKNLFLTTIMDSMELDARVSPDGNSVTSYSRGAGRKDFEESGRVYKIGTPEAAGAEKEWPNLLARLKTYRAQPRNVDLSKFYVENINTATSGQLQRARFFYGQFFVMNSNACCTTLYPLMGYLPNGKPTFNLGNSPIRVPASEIGIRPPYQIVNVSADNPLFSMNPLQHGTFAKSPMLPY